VLYECEELLGSVEFSDTGASVTDMSPEEICSDVLIGYERLGEDIPELGIEQFDSTVKPVIMSKLMTKLEILGIYSYFTGESNINVAFPDYTIPFTAAHELAHQRGIAREDEANMIAFLVCIGSDDPYIQYSAYLNVYEYVSSALYQADRDAFYEVHGELYTSVRKEQAAYSAFFSKYNDSVASKVTGTVNDAYLKSQGTAGRKSYGMVVDLTVAYLKQQNIISNQSSN
jgi:hypothetical protein